MSGGINLVGLVGRKGSGKSVAAGVLMERGFEVVKFAGPLKNMLRTLGLGEEQIEGSEKEVPSELLCGKTPRHAMQTLGTEWGRNLIGENVWVNAWRWRANAILGSGGRVVVDDVRFENEVNVILALGGTLIGIRRPSVSSDDVHESERRIDALPHHFLIENNSTIESLQSRVVSTMIAASMLYDTP